MRSHTIDFSGLKIEEEKVVEKKEHKRNGVKSMTYAQYDTFLNELRKSSPTKGFYQIHDYLEGGLLKPSLGIDRYDATVVRDNTDGKPVGLLFQTFNENYLYISATVVVKQLIGMYSSGEIYSYKTLPVKKVTSKNNRQYYTIDLKEAVKIA